MKNDLRFIPAVLDTNSSAAIQTLNLQTEIITIGNNPVPLNNSAPCGCSSCCCTSPGPDPLPPLGCIKACGTGCGKLCICLRRHHEFHPIIQEAAYGGDYLD